jgi:mRNA interferase HigB
MRVLALKALRAFWETHPDTESPLKTWYKVTEKARWQSLADLKATFPATDHVKGELVVFNVHRNKVRISANVVFRTGFLYIRKVMTHDEYQRATDRGQI